MKYIKYRFSCKSKDFQYKLLAQEYEEDGAILECNQTNEDSPKIDLEN